MGCRVSAGVRKIAAKVASSAPAAGAAAEAASGAGGWLRKNALPILAGVGTGIAGKRVYDDVTFAEENRRAGVRV